MASYDLVCDAVRPRVRGVPPGVPQGRGPRVPRVRLRGRAPEVLELPDAASAAPVAGLRGPGRQPLRLRLTAAARSRRTERSRTRAGRSRAPRPCASWRRGAARRRDLVREYDSRASSAPRGQGTSRRAARRAPTGDRRGHSCADFCSRRRSRALLTILAGGARRRRAAQRGPHRPGTSPSSGVIPRYATAGDGERRRRDSLVRQRARATSSSRRSCSAP